MGDFVVDIDAQVADHGLSKPIGQVGLRKLYQGFQDEHPDDHDGHELQQVWIGDDDGLVECVLDEPRTQRTDGCR